jgi:hypothetical protein
VDAVDVARLPVLVLTEVTMRHAPLLAAAVAAAALAACDQPFLSARIEVPEVRIAGAETEFPTTNIDPTYACSVIRAITGHNCSGVNRSYDVGGNVPAINQKGVGADLRLTDVVLHVSSASAAAHLGGITRAQVSLIGGDGGLTRVASFVRPCEYPDPASVSTLVPTVDPTSVHTVSCAQIAYRPTTIRSSGAANVNLAPFLQSGKLDARVEVEMDPLLLPSGFTATVEAGFSAIVTLDYKSAL